MVWWACDVQFPSLLQCLLCISKTNNSATDTCIIIITVYVTVIATITNTICLHTITNIYSGNNYTRPTPPTRDHHHHDHHWQADFTYTVCELFAMSSPLSLSLESTMYTFATIISGTITITIAIKSVPRTLFGSISSSCPRVPHRNAVLQNGTFKAGCWPYSHCPCLLDGSKRWITVTKYMKLPSLEWHANHVEVAADDTGVCNIYLGDRCVNYKRVPKFHLKRRQGKPKSQEYDQSVPRPLMRMLPLRSLKCLFHITLMHAIRPVHTILLYFITLIVFIEEYNRRTFTDFLVLYQYNFLAYSMIMKQIKTYHTTKYNRMYSSESDGCQHRYNGLRYHGHVDKNSVPTRNTHLGQCSSQFWNLVIRNSKFWNMPHRYFKIFVSSFIKKHIKLHSRKA